MRNLSSFLENPFDDRNIAMDELIAFCTDHLQRFVANNPGALWNARITATTVAMAAVENSATDDLTKLGLRKAKKKVKDTFREGLPEKVAMIHAVVVAKYGPHAPQLMECYPLGRSIFSNCTDDAVENHLQTQLNGVAAHQADLGPAVVADAGGLLSTWLGIWGGSETSGGTKTATEKAKQTARENLQLELFKNLLTIALNFPRQPEKLPLYMQQSLLEDHPQQPPAPPPPGP